MATSRFIPLSHRALFTLGGEERKTFLQGLVSNDVTKVDAGHALYSAFLTPQGKFLHEFFLGELGDVLLVETEAERRADFLKRLSLYKLRSKVTLAAADALRAYAIIGADAGRLFELGDEPGSARPFAGGLILRDPRLADAGLRAWLPAEGEAALREAGLVPGNALEWDRQRIGLGLPDGSRDMVPDKAILLENGFDELHGVDWQKGCYLGQELTARTKYRGLVRKRLLPVDIEGPAPEAGAIIELDGAEAGEMRSHAGNVGLAVIRLEAFEQIAADGRALRAGESRLTPRKPAWAVF